MTNVAAVQLFFLIYGVIDVSPRILCTSGRPLCLRLRGGRESSGNFDNRIPPESISPRYGWDQDKEHVEIYILLEGTKSLWGENWHEHLNVSLSRCSVRISISNLLGKNYELFLDGLYEEINACQALIQTRNDCILVRIEKVRVSDSSTGVSSTDGLCRSS